MFYDDDDPKKPVEDWWRWDDLAVAALVVVYLVLGITGVFG